VIPSPVEMPALKGSFKHVVFADSTRMGRRPLNFATLPISPPMGNTLPPEAKGFVQWLFEQSGLNLSCYREDTLARRLPACLRMLRVHSVAGARKALEENRGLLESAIGSLVIGVTSFFRDAAVFEFLAAHALPLGSESGRTLRIWSLGCSDGQEIYSIAMLLAEMSCLDRAELLGTDCRIEAIRRARRGIYSRREIESLPPALLRQYFTASEDAFELNQPVRSAVHWRTADATQLIEPGAWDLIVCRNLAMYLAPMCSTELWRNLSNGLRPGGYLVVGKAEHLGIAGLRPVASCIFQKNPRLNGTTLR